MKMVQNSIFSFLMVITILSQITEITSKRPPCDFEGYYKNPLYKENKKLSQCIRCSSCPIGQGVVQRCTDSNDTVCHPCTKGVTFSSIRSQRTRCMQCKKCAPNQIKEKSCSAKRDTRCGSCKVGYYWNSIYDKCEACSWCFPDLINPRNALIVSGCVKKEIPSDFQCAKLTIPLYPQETWPKRKQALKDVYLEQEESTSSSGDDVKFFPNDDEDDVTDDVQPKEINENATFNDDTTATIPFSKDTNKTTFQTTLHYASTDDSKHLKSPILFQPRKILEPNQYLAIRNSPQSAVIVLFGVVTALLVWFILCRKYTNLANRFKTSKV